MSKPYTVAIIGYVGSSSKEMAQKLAVEELGLMNIQMSVHTKCSTWIDERLREYKVVILLETQEASETSAIHLVKSGMGLDNTWNVLIVKNKSLFLKSI